MKEGEKIDRLQMLRFSSSEPASRGGMAEPVFAGNWFFGINYPQFHSRHNNDFKCPDYHYGVNFAINLDDGDREYAQRDGLVTLFHFPGYAKELLPGSWGIQGKRAVMGISAKKGDNAELGLMDYINTYRKPTRSYTHFNNWYTSEAKLITVECFVDNAAKKLQRHLAEYGATLDAMVPDNGWQNKSNFKKIYETDSRNDALPEVGAALKELGIGFGIWLAIDGTTYRLDAGERVGYKRARADNYKHTAGRWGGKNYFNILQKQYQQDYKNSIERLIVDSGVEYIKHDFNHMFVADHLSERHAREACLDVTLDLVEFERRLNPDILINFTNGSFFSPFYLLFFEYLWMNAGDSGTVGDWPQLCILENATSYRDSHFFQSFNNPERCERPFITIANFMTHGILNSNSKRYYDPARDPVHDWVNYVVMYYARGTLLKELYISPDSMTQEQWKGLGTATAWAQANADRMNNTVFIGGDCSQGQVYGYVSWNENRGFLSVRNPDRRAQKLEVPFGRHVYYRGDYGKEFRARVVYPFVEEMPWTLVSGERFSVEVPGDSVMVLYLEPGAPSADSAATPEPLPAFKAECDRCEFKLELRVPDETFKRYDLVITDFSGRVEQRKDKKGKTRATSVFPEATIEIQGERVELDRCVPGQKWRISSMDLRRYRGQTITVNGAYTGEREIKAGQPFINAWLVVDRKVEEPDGVINEKDKLPWLVSRGYRRLTQELIPSKELPH